MDMATGRIPRCFQNKDFDDLTINELREIVVGTEDAPAEDLEAFRDSVEMSQALRVHLDGEDSIAPPGLDSSESPSGDGQVMIFEDEATDKKHDGEILNLDWRSEPEAFDNKRWVKVKSVMDSGASAPVAPPQMMPSVKIVPSEGSKRGQRYSSASKHKLRNLGQQHIKAMTEEGDPTEVLFQIADVSKPLVSVSAICEKGNRVIFGKAGGVVQNIKSGRLIPFYRENGIYVLTLWLEEGVDESPEASTFTRP